MTRRHTTVAALAVLAVVAGGAAVGQRALGADGTTAAADAPPGPTPDPADVETATVERRDLVTTEEVDGRLTHTGERTVAAPDGTVTWLAPEGTVVAAGDVLLRVDDEPVVLLPGDLPAYRDLAVGDEGRDVEQLEQALVDLGHATADDMTVDEDYTWATADVVQRWQEDLGVEEDGRVDLGDVVHGPAPLRVAEHLVAPGDAGAVDALRLTGTERVVAVDLEASERDDVAEGDAVEVELPDGTVVPATVERVGDVATSPEGGEGDPTVEVEIALDDPADAWDEAPVTVHLVATSVEDVLAVPVHALVALAEGGYALDVVGLGLVAVDTGAFADGWVEVTGDLEEGDVVVIAS